MVLAGVAEEAQFEVATKDETLWISVFVIL